MVIRGLRNRLKSSSQLKFFKVAKKVVKTIANEGFDNVKNQENDFWKRYVLSGEPPAKCKHRSGREDYNKKTKNNINYC